MPTGVVILEEGTGFFIYDNAYLDDSRSIALAPELPLTEGVLTPPEGMTLAGVLRDGMPDGWGQTVLRRERPDQFSSDGFASTAGLMLLSGSDRFGALDFQESGSDYISRTHPASLDELQRAAELIEAGETLSPELDAALLHGTSIGGARPKALLRDGDRHLIAKFSSASDSGLRVINAEAACLDLAHRAGMDAARGEVVHSAGKDVLLVDRFDRDASGHRSHTVSALTMLGLDELAGRYATYPELYAALMEHGAPASTGREIFGRIVFNVLTSNFDDHPRNHAAFWDGRNLRLTPAFDLAPGHRSGDTAKQAMAIDRDGTRESTLPTCLHAAAEYGLSRRAAEDCIQRIVETLHDSWFDAADQARLSDAEATRLFGRQILNPAAFYGLSSRRITNPRA